MTEGPQARAIALLINQSLAGRRVENVFIRSRRIRVPLENLVSKKLDRADSYGKNILLFMGEYSIRIHPLMYGTVKLYKIDEQHNRPERQVRVNVEFDEYRIVGFNTPVVEVDYAEKIVSWLKSTLGPDPYKPGWNRAIVMERLRRRGGEKIGSIVLDQSVIAGIGNILRNEVLFRAGVNPERTVESLCDEELQAILDAVEALFKEFLERLIMGEGLKNALLIYNKYNGVCPRCGSRIKYYRQEPHKRKTFMCPKCQR
ncbi:MAG: hypothetical protein QXH45_00660 [Thermosphaera sp.]